MSENLPPGVSLSDVDGSFECPACDGSGQIEIVSDPDQVFITCQTCGGTGVRGSTRGAKFTDDIKPGE